MSSTEQRDWSSVEKLIENAVHHYSHEQEPGVHYKDMVTPGAVLLVGLEGSICYKKAFGCRSLLPTVSPMEEGLVFDVASLTKVMLTTTLIMQLVDSGQLTIDRRLSHLFQTFNSHGKERMTTRHLLNHSSGFPAYIPYYKKIEQADLGPRAGMMASRGATEMVYNEIFRARIDNLPGKVANYSDIGFMLLAAAAELAHGGKTLEKLAVEKVLGPLELRNTGFIDLKSLGRGGLEPVSDVIVPTTDCPWRGRMICGEVQDENAWAMGGVAGHAGFFSTAEDVHRFAVHLLDCYQGRSNFISKDVVREFWTRDSSVPGSSWALGWDTPSAGGSSSGKYFSPKSVGHLGYTGCSLWIDPERELVVVLLTNRVHPSSDNKRIKEFRPLIHDAVMETLGFGES